MKYKQFLLSAMIVCAGFTQAGEMVTDICGNSYPAVTIGNADGGGVHNVGYYACFWSATPYEYADGSAYYYELSYLRDNLNEDSSYGKDWGRSVRCVKN